MLMNSGRQRRVALGLVFLVASCGDGLVPEQGAFVGRWDGRPWIGDATVTLVRGAPGGDVLYVFGSKPRGAGAFGLEESISANTVFAGAGVYALDADQVSFMELTGGDVITAWYTGVGSPAGRLVISRYDESTGEIEGELQFTAATDDPSASYGTRARLEDGKFRAIVAVQVANTRAP